MRVVIVGAVESTLIALRAVTGTPGWSVVAVVTLPPAFASRHSDYVDLNDPAYAAGAAVIHAANSNTPEVCSQIRALAADFVFVIGWSQICRAEFLEAAGGRVIGYHPAALPRLRGRGVLPWTILLTEPITAGTLFWIDNGVDSGAILAQHFFHIGNEDSVTSLYARHLEVLTAMLSEALPALASDDPPRRIQDERFATFAAKRTPADGVIDWNRSATDIARLVRAVSRPYPGASTSARDELLTIWSATVEANERFAAASVGQVIAVNETGFLVRCGCGGTLRINDWQSASQRLPALHSRLGTS